MSLFLKLFLAHILGDFVLQFDSWVADKEKRKLKSPYLYLHAVIHFLLIVLIGWDFGLWKIALGVSIAHLIIDTAKIYVAQKTQKQQWPFFVDQALHIFVIGFFAFSGKTDELMAMVSEINLKVVTAYIFLSYPAGIIMKKLLVGWNFEEPQNASLPKAGMVIGILERVLVLTFILLNHWEAIGFLITAKSVFRFNDLKASERRLTEYILIGTLLSFGIAILSGVLLKISF